MDNIWSFFEELDEMVYVSDVETHELVYMNRHLREALGYDDHTVYSGKKCHKVLQGFGKPCTFCTNQQLQLGKFISWTHKNPVLNKRFLVKDTMVYADGRYYRMEIAIDADSDVEGKSTYYYARSETILNECMQQMFSSAGPEISIQNMLSYIGKTFSCDRAYIFEIYPNDTTTNTYEWCSENVVPQKEFLQKVPLSAVDWWLKSFADGKVTVIPDLESIRTTYPESYAILKPQDIHSLAAGPIKLEGEIIGFIGVDNLDSQMVPLMVPLLNVIGYFTSTLLKRRDLISRLNELSYHDQLTGALNRHALSEQYGDLPMNSVGVIYCDITGLKKVNDTQGHEAGDRMICYCYNLLREAAETNMIYRTGGDEFIALYPNCEKQHFYDSVSQLQQKILEDDIHIAVGHAWSNKSPLILEKLITKADEIMYQDKREYYRKNANQPGVERRQSEQDFRYMASQKKANGEEDTLLGEYLSKAVCDVEVLFQSVAQDNQSSYFYLGDMQKDIYYISDNMKEDFGFRHNLVKGLLRQWAKRISTREFQQLYWADINNMLEEKRTHHDLRYQVRDAQGNNQWIRCYGILKWNEDKTKPLFFSGRVTHQDKNFVVDPISNLPRENASFQNLAEMKKNGEKTLVIGFSLNGVSELNNTKGRAQGDRLLKKVANALMEKLFWKMSFYRLEGMRCMAIVNAASLSETPESLVQQIREIAQECYADMDVSVQNVCSFGVMQYPSGEMKPDDLIENLVSLIRVAKQEPKLRYVDYSTQNIQRIKQMSNMVLALSQNVAHNMENFRVMIQPIVSAGDGSAIGGEVLLRWTFEGQTVSPATFIPILEKQNLIQPVGRWVFEQAVATCKRIHSHDPNFYLTVNFSLQQLSDPLLLPFMKETLKKYRLEGSSLVAELTESCLDEQPERLRSFVDECQEMGLYIALDDFGSGYSSMRMLLQYPFGIIKLDRSLVLEVTQSEAKMHFIRSIVFACHQFGKTVCMEGVEDEAQNQIIQNTGCDMIQGYYYHRPMEISQIYQLVGQADARKHREDETACQTQGMDYQIAPQTTISMLY